MPARVSLANQREDVSPTLQLMLCLACHVTTNSDSHVTTNSDIQNFEQPQERIALLWCETLDSPYELSDSFDIGHQPIH